jgi:hypothetical protein
MVSPTFFIEATLSYCGSGQLPPFGMAEKHLFTGQGRSTVAKF